MNNNNLKIIFLPILIVGGGLIVFLWIASLSYGGIGNLLNAPKVQQEALERKNFLNLQNPNSEFYMDYNIATQFGGAACENIAQGEVLRETINGKSYYTAEELIKICKKAAKESDSIIKTPKFEHEIYEYLWEARLHKDISICDEISKGDSIIDSNGILLNYSAERLREECRRLYKDYIDDLKNK